MHAIALNLELPLLMSFLTTSATAMDAADLLQSHIQLTVENAREKLQRFAPFLLYQYAATDNSPTSMLKPTSEAMVTLDTIASKVADHFMTISLQQKRKTASFLRSEAAYYRNRRERLQADDLLGQLQDIYLYTTGPLQEVRPYTPHSVRPLLSLLDHRRRTSTLVGNVHSPPLLP